MEKMTDQEDDILRNMIETKLQPSCEIYKETLKDKIRYFKLRKYIANKILGKKRRGGILMEVDISRKTKEEVDAFWEAIKLLRKSGITFDTGCGCVFDMELGWSLKGAVAHCCRCGYNSEEDRIKMENEKLKRHFVKPCDKCGKDIDSSNGFWHTKKHFWSKKKIYHTNCYNQENRNA